MEQPRGNLVKLTNSHGSLSANSAPFLVEKFSKTETAFLIGRMISVYREKPGASMEALVSEWHDALRFYDPDRVATAWRTWRNTQKFLPSIAEILGLLKEQAPRVGPSPRAADPAEAFCQEGRTEAEEIAHRASIILNAKRRYGYADRYSAPDEPAEEAPKPASQGGLSPALIELSKRQGIYCGPAETPNQQDSQ